MHHSHVVVRLERNDSSLAAAKILCFLGDISICAVHGGHTVHILGNAL